MIEGEWSKLGSIDSHRRLRCLAALLLSGSMIPGLALAKTFHQPGMPSPNVGENIALDADGGYVAGYSSQHESTPQGASWDAPLLIDGQLSTGWETARGKVRNQWVKIGFTGNGLFRITKVLIDPAATQGDPATADLKNFEIRISTSSLKASFTTVLRGTCRQGNYLQSFTLAKPVRVRFIELYALDNYGNRSRLAVAELEVVGTGGY